MNEWVGEREREKEEKADIEKESELQNETTQGRINEQIRPLILHCSALDNYLSLVRYKTVLRMTRSASIIRRHREREKRGSDVTFPMKSEDDRSRNSFARANRMCRRRDCLREEWADDFSSLFFSSHNNDRLKRRNQNDSPVTIKGDCYCYDDDIDILERSQRNELTSDNQQEFTVKFSMEWK